MSFEVLAAEVPSLQKLVDWFGFWPSFHDSEVVSIALNRDAVSSLVVHTFATTGETNATGHYVTEKHALVHFLLEGVNDSELLGFNHQNVLSCLVVAKVETGYELTLGGCYGLEGWIVAENFSVKIVPGLLEHSIYAGTIVKEAATV